MVSRREILLAALLLLPGCTPIGTNTITISCNTSRGTKTEIFPVSETTDSQDLKIRAIGSSTVNDLVTNHLIKGVGWPGARITDMTNSCFDLPEPVDIEMDMGMQNNALNRENSQAILEDMVQVAWIRNQKNPVPVRIFITPLSVPNRNLKMDALEATQKMPINNCIAEIDDKVDSNDFLPDGIHRNFNGLSRLANIFKLVAVKSWKMLF
jgi:hypothetical protein